MKLYVIDYKTPMEFSTIRDIAKKADPLAVVYVNEESNSKSFEVQSKKVADRIIDTLGGSLRIIDYNIKDILK
jgi:hypothetical protein